MKKAITALALLLLASRAFASVAIDTGNSVGFAQTASTLSESVTVGASDNFLVLICTGWNVGASMPPFSPAPTYGAAALTEEYSWGTSGGGGPGGFIYYLASPTSGTATLSGTFAGADQPFPGYCAALVMSGVNTGAPFGTPNSVSASGASGSLTVTGAGSSGLYIGTGYVSSAAISTTGSPMVNLYTANDFSGTNSISIDYIPGSSTGDFGYSGSGSSHTNITAVGILASGGASCTHSGITSAGAIAVPNGSTGSYRGKTGGFVTPDCSTVQYLQPTVGNFGVN